MAQNSAWITTWDDHEVANNGYRDGFSGLNNTEASFLADGRRVSVDARKMNAVRAYFEWMPIRQVDLDDNLRIWRAFSLGNLVDLIVLDTRNYDRSITSLGDWNDHYIDLIRDEASRSLMGGRQEKWFYRQLSESKKRGAKWRVVGSQVIFSGASGLDTDNWSVSIPPSSCLYLPIFPLISTVIHDGGLNLIEQAYLANRNRTLQHLYTNNITNNIFLAGDSHRNWVADVAWVGKHEYNSTTGAGAVGVEFAGTAVSSSGYSGGISGNINSAKNLVNKNEVLQWQEGYYRGYFLLSLGKDKATAQFIGLFFPSVHSLEQHLMPEICC